MVTLFILFFVEEKEAKNDDEEEELEISASQAPSIFYNIIMKKEIQNYLFFMFMTYSASSITNNLAQVYLVEELKFPKESIS